MARLSHGQWSSRTTFILATTGAAVGLGNIWKFPYMVGSHGGSAFMFLYLICIVLIGLPIMMAEILIGRQSRQNPVNALHELALKTHAPAQAIWQYLGWWGAAILVIVLSFYSVIAGWSVAYAYFSISGKLTALSAKGVKTLWQSFSGSPIQLIAWHSFFIWITAWIVRRGVNRGLEQSTRIMMPLLFVILLLLVFYSSQTGDFHQAWHFLMHFNLYRITTDVAISAMGHAFFTLAIGAGCLLTYGCYLGRRISIAEVVSITAILDVLVAIFSGLAIFPIIFAYQLPVSSGPGLMFQALPIAFLKMPAGQWIGTLFFILILFAALTSTISLAEPPVILLMERYRLSRTSAITAVASLSWLLGLGSALSFNRWQHYQWMHWTFFDIVTNLVTNIMLPIGGLGFCLFAGWILPKELTHKALDPCPKWLHRSWRCLVRYVAPLGILLILLAPVLPFH